MLRGGTPVEAYAFARIKTKHTHGTGCTLFAIVRGLARGLSLPLAVGRAREYVQYAVSRIGKGHRPLNHAR